MSISDITSLMSQSYVTKLGALDETSKCATPVIMHRRILYIEEYSITSPQSNHLTRHSHSGTKNLGICEDSQNKENFIDLTQEETPMEIDTNTSAENSSTMIQDTCNVVSDGTKRLLKLKETNSEIEKPKKYFNLKKLLHLFTILLIAYCVSNLIKWYNIRKLPIEQIEEHLLTKVISQRQQMNDFVRALKHFDESGENTHVTLLGTTGVGKTHSINILKQLLKNHQVFDVDLNREKSKIIYNTILPLPTVILIDNLRIDDLPNTVQYIEDNLLTQKTVFLVTIFNVESSNDFVSSHVNVGWLEKIINTLKKLPYELHPIIFHSYKNDKMDGHFEEFKNIFKHLLKEILDLERKFFQHDFTTFGFKGLFAKLDIDS